MWIKSINRIAFLNDTQLDINLKLIMFSFYSKWYCLKHIRTLLKFCLWSEENENQLFIKTWTETTQQFSPFAVDLNIEWKYLSIQVKLLSIWYKNILCVLSHCMKYLLLGRFIRIYKDSTQSGETIRSVKPCLTWLDTMTPNLIIRIKHKNLT